MMRLNLTKTSLRIRCVRWNSSQSSTNTNASISNKQLLYTQDASTPGSVFFLPHGTRVFNKLITFMKHQQMKYGFEEVVTPLIYKTKLWETSGHWQNYKDDMFKVVGNVQRDEVGAGAGATAETENGTESGSTEDYGHKHDEHEHDHESEHTYGLKPMNCPGHCLIFSKFERSYNELPVRLSDFSSLHRNEASGALSGLTRVRRFHQDDGHIFCELSQIEQEIDNTIKLIKDTYKIFGITDVQFKLSTRPEKAIGDLETWAKAEAALEKVLNATTNNNWLIREGDGAFYGPKIDVLVTDAFLKEHQVGTIQLDFQLPERFQLKYVAKDGTRDNQPIMVHRAVFGSLERFFAILLDHYQGKWPFWLNPRQAVIIPVNEAHHRYCEEVAAVLRGDIVSERNEIAPMTGYNFYVDVDSRNETIGARIKDAISKGYSYIITIGDKDIEKGTVAVRTRESRKLKHYEIDELYDQFIELEKDFK